METNGLNVLEEIKSHIDELTKLTVLTENGKKERSSYARSVEELLRIFYSDYVKTYYYLEYMNRLMDKIFPVDSKDNFDMVVLVAKKGVICFRAFLKLYKYSININDKKSELEKKKQIDQLTKMFIIDSRTMCHYDFKKFADNKKTKIEDLKICVFDDTLNLGRNFLNILGSLGRRGVKGENITFASPSINRLILDKDAKSEEHSSYINKDDIKYGKEISVYGRNEYQENPNDAKIKAKLFNPIDPNETYKRNEYIFNNYFDKDKSRGFVGYDEIVSRAYQLNQLAHFENVPYTSYCAYVKSRYNEVNGKIKEALNPKNEEFKEFKEKFQKDSGKFNNKFKHFIYKDDHKHAIYEEVEDIRMKVCSSVGVKSRVIFTNFNAATASYYGLRIFENIANPDSQGNKFFVFYPFVTLPPLDTDGLKEEYKEFFTKGTDINIDKLLFSDENNFLNEILKYNENSGSIDEEAYDALWKDGFDFITKEFDGKNKEIDEMRTVLEDEETLKFLDRIDQFDELNEFDESDKKYINKENKKGYYLKKLKYLNKYETERLSKSEKKIVEKLVKVSPAAEILYYRRKALHECAMRRLLNIKTAMVAFDFLTKLKNTKVMYDDKEVNVLDGEISEITCLSYKELNNLKDEEIIKIEKEVRGLDENGIPTKSYGNLVFSLAKCVVKQMFQDFYKPDTDKLKMIKVIKALDLIYKRTENGKSFGTGLPKGYEELGELEKLYGECFFKAHEHDDGKSYKVLAITRGKFLEKKFFDPKIHHIENYLIKNDSSQYLFKNKYEKHYAEFRKNFDKKMPQYADYLEFSQAMGRLFYRLKSQDTTMYKLPPFATHFLLNMIIFKIYVDRKGGNTESLEPTTKSLYDIFYDNRLYDRTKLKNFVPEKNKKLSPVILSYLAAMISISEDGFAGTVVYGEPFNGIPTKPFYCFNCVQHGEDPVQVLELYFGDYLCLNSLLESFAYNVEDVANEEDRNEIHKVMIEEIDRKIKDFEKEIEIENGTDYSMIKKDAQKFLLLAHLVKDFMGSEEYATIRKKGEGIYRSSIYTEQSPLFLDEYMKGGKADEKILRFFSDIYDIKKTVLSQIIEKTE